MTHGPIVLSVQQLADATGGRWENLPQEGLTITSVAFRLSQIVPGCLAITYNMEQWDKRGDTESQQELLFSRGACAVVVREAAPCPGNRPVLRVHDTRKALRDIAITTSLYASAYRVLVTGSVGKTGFKTQLHHLIKDTVRAHAALNSGNMDLPIWANLASMRSADSHAIFEVAVPGPGLGATRALYVRPDLGVITAIGAEHIKQHGGTIADIIANKASVARGLRPGGTMIVPGHTPLLEQLRTEIRKHSPDATILCFGTESHCNAQLIEKQHDGFAWAVTARIGEEVVSYHLPLLEDYAPESSLAVLLAAQVIGADVPEVVRNYADYRQFKTSGKFYRLQRKGKTLFLYDQSLRGELDGFKSTLRLIAQLTPPPGGRKVAVFSEFTNLEEGSVDLIDQHEFSQLIGNAGIDALYTAHFFTEHINVLPDRSIWKDHSMDIATLIEEIIGSLSDNDMLFVRGTLKSNLARLTERLLRDADSVEVLM